MEELLLVCPRAIKQVDFIEGKGKNVVGNVNMGGRVIGLARKGIKEQQHN